MTNNTDPARVREILARVIAAEESKGYAARFGDEQRRVPECLALDAIAAALASAHPSAPDDVDRLVRELDVALNGPEGAAAQASLCDVVGQVQRIVRERGAPLLAPSVTVGVEGLLKRMEVQAANLRRAAATNREAGESIHAILDAGHQYEPDDPVGLADGLISDADDGEALAALLDEARAALSQQSAAPVLAKHQPCGCVICTCEDERQCQGCGAKHCGNRTDHPPYVGQQPAAPSGEWRPIETAPRDGVEFLSVANYADEPRQTQIVDWDFVQQCQPGLYTHWMPLPEPPEVG